MTVRPSRSRSRTPNPARARSRAALAAGLALALPVAAALAAAGCSLNRSALGLKRGEGSLLGPVQVGGGGQVIEPKRVLLSVVILPRPLHDPAVNEAVWASADEQPVPDAARRLLEANGLRLGVLTGGLPPAVEAAVNAPPPNQVAPSEFNLPDGQSTLVSLAEATPTVSLLLNLGGRAFGKDFKEASGWFRVTASHDGPTGVGLRLVPEVHHGPVTRRYDALPNTTGAPSALQFMLKDGQQEDTLRELAAAVTLQPGQVAVLGCRPDQRGNLGSFLFTQSEANSDRLLQKVLLIRVSRSTPGLPGSQPKPDSDLEPVDTDDDGREKADGPPAPPPAAEAAPEPNPKQTPKPGSEPKPDAPKPSEPPKPKPADPPARS